MALTIQDHDGQQSYDRYLISVFDQFREFLDGFPTQTKRFESDSAEASLRAVINLLAKSSSSIERDLSVLEADTNFRNTPGLHTYYKPTNQSKGGVNMDLSKINLSDDLAYLRALRSGEDLAQPAQSIDLAEVDKANRNKITTAKQPNAKVNDGYGGQITRELKDSAPNGSLYT